MAPLSRAERRIALPARRLLRVGFGLAAASLLLPLWPLLVPFFVGALLVVAMLLVADFVTRGRRADVVVWRELRGLYHVGRRASWTLYVRNDARRVLEVTLRDVLPAALEGPAGGGRVLLAPGAKARFEVPFVALERGAHALAPIGVRTALPRGLLEHQYAQDTGDQVVVAPGRPAGETAWLLARAALLEESGTRTVPRLGAEWEFESLREYVPGDEPRRIDWKASARHRRPFVRQYQTEQQTELILALDCGRLMGTLVEGIAKLDLAMTPLLDLAAVALRRGERVGLMAFDSRPRVFLPPRPGLPQLAAITQALALLPKHDEPTSYLRAVAHLESKHKKRSLLLVFTDFTDELSARDIYHSLASLARRHVLVFVGVSDAQLEASFADQSTAERALFQRAVAGQLLAERARVLAEIERLGVLTVDAEPRKLTAPLLSRYLEVRLRGVL